MEVVRENLVAAQMAHFFSGLHLSKSDMSFSINCFTSFPVQIMQTLEFINTKLTDSIV